MSPINVRKEQPEDIPAIRELTTAAFKESAEADIVDNIRKHHKDALSLVATRDEKVVGHILFSPVIIECGKKKVKGMALGPMAVAPEEQRKGIGTELVRAGISRMRGRSIPYVVLVGHPDFYPRFGFERASRRGITCKWDVPDDVFMILILHDPTMLGVTGQAQFVPEFA
ncbi:MAG: N-acetyltransferase [Elusimicrobia bacterium]|nr:N-acetyltransferase [Elusimicrobiota bacterium]